MNKILAQIAQKTWPWPRISQLVEQTLPGKVENSVDFYSSVFLFVDIKPRFKCVYLFFALLCELFEQFFYWDLNFFYVVCEWHIEEMRLKLILSLIITTCYSFAINKKYDFILRKKDIFSSFLFGVWNILGGRLQKV